MSLYPDLKNLSREEALAAYVRLEDHGKKSGQLTEMMRVLAQSDLYYLLVRVCRRADLNHDFFYARCREVQNEPDGMLDLWAREHGKSSIITFGLTIFNIINDPEVTIGIFSHTRPIAKAFLRLIMRELESNRTLHALFPDVLWGTDTKQSPKWSEDDGIIVKRQSNPNEATIEAWGLVDGQPVSKHFKVLLYDDIVVQASVSTPDMIEKTMARLEDSYNLGVSPGGRRRFAGTRWHFNDAYSTILKRGTAKPRIHPGREGGTEEGKSVYWPDETHLEKRRDMGPYSYACHAADTRILMGDWSWKKIQDVQVGDEVVGFVLPKKNSKTRTELVRTKVVATNSRMAKATEYRMESGGVVRCTPDHKWWTGRQGHDGHKVYSALGTGGYRDLSGLVRITEVFDQDPARAVDAAWLAGIIDGEGTISPEGQIIITQSNEHNPAVCEKIEVVLTRLGIDFYINQRKPSTERKAVRMYVLRGGRPMKHRLVTIADFAKREVFVNRGLYGKLGGKHADSKNDKVLSRCELGEIPVYNIQTATENYIANGYASKNCNILLNPKADALQGFKREWLRYYKSLTPSQIKHMNVYILVDAANAKRKSSDYTAMWVVGLNTDGNYYALDIIRDRLNLTERASALMQLHRKFSAYKCPIKQVRYERYGIMADIDHIKTVQEKENYRFDIVEVGGITAKPDRIKRLLPLFEAGKFYLPETLHKTDYQRVPVDLVHSFVEEEYMAFPVGVHDDMFDGLSRLVEPDMKLIWPQEKKEEELPVEKAFQDIHTAWMA